MSLALQPLSLATSVMQRTFSASNATMGSALERLSSGKRFSFASEDLAGFVKMTDLQISQTDYGRRNAGLKQVSAELGTSLSMANEVMEDLKEMKKAWAESEQLTANGDTVGAAAASAKATAIGESITSTLAMTFSDTGGIFVTGTLRSVEFADGTFTDLDTTAKLPVGTEATATTTQDAIDDLSEWIGEVGALKAQVDSQQRIAETMLSNSKAMESAITSIDEAAESARYVDASVRQQASLAMMSQANMARQSILLLYK